MSKRVQTKNQVKSKYFSIDSYFTSENKRVKTTHDQPVEHLLAETKEQCPICQTMIQTEFMSLEVHVNQCLDAMPSEHDHTHTKVDHVDDDAYFDNDDDFIEKVLSFEQQNNKENTSAFSSLKDRFSFTSKDTCLSTVVTEGTSKDTCLSTVVAEGTSKDTCLNTVEGESRISPDSWRDVFSATSDQQLSIVNDRDVNRLKSIVSTGKPKRKQKPCPFYKRIRDTRFTVDAFSFGNIPDCDGYFLSHYHSDHFMGLSASWQEGPIYCSKITANLVRQELRVDSRYIHALPMNELYPIPNSNVTVGLIDANHCPGSVLFLFIVERMDGTKVRHLHTGDFRASPRMCLHPFIRQPENAFINSLYLDTTYLSPEYAFPAQEECIQAVCDTVENDLKAFNDTKKKPSIFDRWLKPKEKNEESLVTNDAFSLLMNKVSTKPRVLIAVGTYTIGKERVFINIARRLKCKVYAPMKKKRILLCQEDEELKGMLTNNPIEAQVHVVPLRDIRADIMLRYLEEYKPHFEKLIAFKPTGWTFKSSKSQTSDMKLGPLSYITLPPADRSLHLSPFYSHEKIKLYGVPYSEHSSFRELASFIASLDIKKIIPTVNISQIESMSVYFDNWEQEKVSKRIEVVPYPNEDYW